MQLPWAIGGGLTVVATAVGFSAASGLLSQKSPVLVVAEPLAAGQTITSDALRTIPVAAEAGVGTIDASMASKVVGRTVAVPLTPGSLLNVTDIGKSTFPPAGQAELAVALRAGAYPLDLAAGDRVQVVVAGDSQLPTPTTNTAAVAPAPVPTYAVVTKVGRSDGQGGTVADLLMDQTSIQKVASAGPSGVSLAVLPPSAGN
ncbi:hypothetical protein KGQ19_11285 [Catenulispora sp. NL8]|uniref:SAF domain-containing protein n=1 Tax=Catenulispora pinistramenti TaxID=2705254 RepID=A0ABS5KN24_9ACTN|nr:SAF domain-containing protein [Catenulispora pinistramenti]MBS2547455.1 hypothetical protein [Catenulispora pinistramenti]